MQRMEGDAGRGGTVGDIPVAGEMERIGRLDDRMRLSAFREKPVQ